MKSQMSQIHIKTELGSEAFSNLLLINQSTFRHLF